MDGCCGNLRERLPPISDGWHDSGKNILASALSGLFFSVGWWVMIDAACMYPSNEEMHHAYHTCGVIATIAMFMINTVSNAQITGDGYEEGCMGSFAAKIWFFIGLMLNFGSLIGACWILFDGYVVPGKVPVYPGVAVFLQNLFIFLSSLLYKFGRASNESGF